MAPRNRLQQLRSAIRRRGVARGARLWIETAAAIVTVAAVAIGLANHFTADSERTFPGEGKRVVAFRQVANRICTEHQGNMHRAIAEGRTRVERLGFIARGIGWDLNDLESVTPPPTRFDPFLAEIAIRRQIRLEVLALQRAIELGSRSKHAKALANIEQLEAESRERSREAGLSHCATILPPSRSLLE
ncbi:MAG TPA: hypothetical protein VMT37_16150 [Solirubrobacterales bacterium]|nr:hypothetical protein [Solirubrobacterales bacterium]